MATTLSPEQENIVKEKIATGRFADADAVLDEALRLLMELDHDDPLPIEELRQAIALADEQIKQGKCQRVDSDTLQAHMDQVKAEGRRRLELRQQKAAS